MPESVGQVLLPFAALPTTDCVLGAVANVIRDIQRDHDLTDLQFAERVGVHVNTVSRARNKQTKLDMTTIARIGAVFGEQSLRPFTSLWSGGSGAEPVAPTAKALAALAGVKGIHSELEALPLVKDAIAAMSAWAGEVERKRLRVVA